MATSKDENTPLIPIVVGLVVLSAVLAVGLLIWADNGESDGLPETPAPAVATESASGSETLPETAGVAAPVSEDGRAENGSRAAGAISSDTGQEPPPANFSDLLSQPATEAGTAVRDEMRVIAESSGSQAQKVARFKSYLRPQNDGPTQNLAVRHLSKLVKDEQYNEYLADELLDPNHSEAVRAALIRDINGRNRQVMLPVMVEIATLPEHPLKDYAHETLGRYLGDSYSANPDNLRGAVNEFMRRKNDKL